MGIETERTEDADAHEAAAERLRAVRDSEANGFVLITFDPERLVTTLMSNMPPDKIAYVVALVNKAHEEEAAKAQAANTVH